MLHILYLMNEIFTIETIYCVNLVSVLSYLSYILFTIKVLISNMVSVVNSIRGVAQ